MFKQRVGSASWKFLAQSTRGQLRQAFSRTSRRQSSSDAKSRDTPTAASAWAAFTCLGAVGTGYVFFGNTSKIYAEQPEAFAQAPAASTCSLKSMPVISYDLSDENITGAEAEFGQLLGTDRISINLGERISKSSTEWSAAPHGDADRFNIIVSPKTTVEVAEIAKICHRRRIPMIAYSGGTSLEGTLAAVHGGVCVDFRLMNKVIEVRKNDMDVTLQPAVGYQELNAQLADEGLFFPPDPGPGAQIGGMISQGCSGTNAFRYGTMKDWVLGLTIVLADGTIVQTRGRPRKSSSGYDLTRLMVGSEGTLGFVTEAHLKLTSAPQNERVAVAQFPNTQAALDTAVKIVQNDLQLGAMELLCDASMRAVNEGGYCEQEYSALPTLFFKFAGQDKEAIERLITLVERFAKESKCKSFEFSSSDEEKESIWEARKTVLWSLLATKNDPSDEFISSDTAVPISQLATAVDDVKRKISEAGMQGSCLGHVGDGNFHTSIIYSADQREEAREMITWVQRQAIEMGGTITGEHGIGHQYAGMLEEEVGENSVAMMRQIKLALDPLCLLNPDKVFRLNVEKE